MGIGAVVALFHITKEPGFSVLVVGWLIASVYLIWFARRLKFVSMDESFLYVSGYRKEIQIPLAHVEKVKENFWARPKLITLTLNHPSEFGEKIVFVPTSLFFAAVRSHPIVEEFENIIKSHRRAGSVGV